MKARCNITKLHTGWMLTIITHNVDTNLNEIKHYTFNKLVDALQHANWLKQHIDNLNEYRVTQYKKVA